MRRPTMFAGALACGSALVLLTVSITAEKRSDFGLHVAKELRSHAEHLFGFRHPLEESSFGPYDGTDNTKASIERSMMMRALATMVR